MIYYLDEPVLWNRQGGLSEIEVKVRAEMEKIKAKFFSPTSLGYAKVIYPKGKPEGGLQVFGILKKLPIFYKSDDGTIRFSETKATLRNGQKDYGKGHRMLTYQTLIKENEIEFLWFLINHSNAYGKKVFIEDLEAEAKNKVTELATDADIKYLIMGKNSPIAKDEVLLKNAAETFGIRDVEKKGISQIKMDLYNLILDGEAKKDNFVNFKKFEEITSSENKSKAAFVARRAINDKIVRYKDRAWYLYEGGELSERLVELLAREVEFKEEIFIEKVINDENVKARLFAFVNEDAKYSREDYLTFGLQTLKSLAKELGHKPEQKDTKEVLVNFICEKKNIK